MLVVRFFFEGNEISYPFVLSSHINILAVYKKIIGIAFIEEGANLFLICLGYKAGGVVPIFLPGMNADWFAANAAYPLPQALVLTSIVIGASTLAVMLALAMVLYRKHGTLSVSEIMGDEK